MHLIKPTDTYTKVTRHTHRALILQDVRQTIEQIRESIMCCKIDQCIWAEHNRQWTKGHCIWVCRRGGQICLCVWVFESDNTHPTLSRSRVAIQRTHTEHLSPKRCHEFTNLLVL